jgi:hypothetical protein
MKFQHALRQAVLKFHFSTLDNVFIKFVCSNKNIVLKSLHFQTLRKKGAPYMSNGVSAKITNIRHKRSHDKKSLSGLCCDVLHLKENSFTIF